MISFLSSFTDYERRSACLKALLNCTEFDFFKLDIAEKGIMDILLDIIQNTAENPLDLRETCFNIMSNICKDTRPNRKEFRRKGGVELVKENLQITFSDKSKLDGGNATTFLLAVLNCLNHSIFGNGRSELHFLEIEGVYVLLDLLESS